MTESDRIQKLFADEAEASAKRLDKMAADYKIRGDLVSARNCEAKARELRA